MSAEPEPDLLSRTQKVRELLSVHGVKGWEKTWQESHTPWDAGQSQPALREVIKSGEVPFPKTGTALVPGCGRGYDAIFIAAELGLHTLGVDISRTAINAANQHFLSLEDLPPTTGTVFFHEANFFDWEVTKDDQFNLIYDYTFFCAIPPDMRALWGEKMTQLAKPGCLLITLVYPIDGDREGGPPFSVNVEMYAGCLKSAWAKIYEKVPSQSSDRNKGREKLVVWRRT